MSLRNLNITMNNKLFPFLFVAALACLSVSCTKYALPGDEEEKTPANSSGNSSESEGSNSGGTKVDDATLTLYVSDFSQTDFVSRASAPLKNKCSRLGFSIFNESGKKVKVINQEFSNDGFGTFALNVPDGVYDVVVVGHSTEGSTTISKPDSIRFKNNKVTDTASYYEQITVNGKTSKSITLQRSVAMVRFVVKGVVPENVKQFKFYYTGGSSALNAVTNFGRIKSKQTEYRSVPDDYHTKSGGIFEIFTIPHAKDGELKITVTALDEAGNSVKETVFEKVPVTQEVITVWELNMFGEPEGGDGSESLSPMMMWVED